MNAYSTRRTFLAGLGAATAVTTLPSFAASDRGRGIRFGYTAITWGNEERQAIDDTSAVGFPGMQFRANAVTEFKSVELKELLAQRPQTIRSLQTIPGEKDSRVVHSGF
jgi:inosose dehydratase